MIQTITRMVTPQMANEILLRNTANRPMNWGRVNAYAQAMERNAWEVNGQGIVIDSNGTLKDGQHRLAAIVKYGKPVMLTVTTGVSPNTHMYDRGRGRSTVDNMKIAGYPKGLANNQSVALANAHFCRHRIDYIADDAIISFIDKYADEIDKIVSLCRYTVKNTAYVKTLSANITYPLFCALLSGVPFETISDFVSIVKDGLCYDKQKSSAVVLRNDILGGVVATKSSIADRKRSMAIVSRALRDFVRGVPRSITYKNTNLDDETYMDIAFGKEA